jgi:phytoene desaturase
MELAFCLNRPIAQIHSLHTLRLQKTALIIGAGLGGLATALRLSTAGYAVTVLEQYHQPGGRLNQLHQNGYTFDLGPSFFSMSYEFEELFKSCNMVIPFTIQPLEPVYHVHFANRQKPYKIYKDLDKLAAEFAAVEPHFKANIEKYLAKAKEIFHDTEYRIVKRNYSGVIDHYWALAQVPWKHAPMMFRSMWAELSKHFEAEEVKVIFSLVAFFLGATPFDTPAVYSLLNYTELMHDGYWNVKGGMYQIVSSIVAELQRRGVQFHYQTEIRQPIHEGKELKGFLDKNGQTWSADVYIVNADAASFRGKVLQRPKFNKAKLDRLHWTLAPFTIYLGVKGKINNLEHHNYFLGNNFTDYANKIFRTAVAPEKPYYYVNVSSKSNPDSAPTGCENIFVLCPVPDLRAKPDWSDAQQLTKTIIDDLGQRVGYNIADNIETQVVWTPIDWQDKLHLYKGSGLGLAHDLNQIGGLRPGNVDEIFNSLYYVGASTVPGTGLPIVVIGSRLVTERILKDHGTV